MKTEILLPLVQLESLLYSPSVLTVLYVFTCKSFQFLISYLLSYNTSLGSKGTKSFNACYSIPIWSKSLYPSRIFKLWLYLFSVFIYILLKWWMMVVFKISNNEMSICFGGFCFTVKAFCILCASFGSWNNSFSTCKTETLFLWKSLNKLNEPYSSRTRLVCQAL